MFVVTFLPFSFCALVFPCFHLLFDVGVNGVEFSGLFSDFTILSIFHWEKFSPYMWYLEFGNVILGFDFSPSLMTQRGPISRINT